MLKLENRKILFAYKEVQGEDGEKRKVTFAGEVNENDELSIGFAIAQPRERYHKGLGREIAVGRMEKKPMAKVSVKGLNAGKLFNDYVRELETTDDKLRKLLRNMHEEKLRNKRQNKKQNA